MRALIVGLLLLTSVTALDARPRSHIVRSRAAKCEFLRSQGYRDCRVPKGFVVDHIKPLACGGADAPSNMQLQSVEAGKAKDKTERIGCHGGHR